MKSLLTDLDAVAGKTAYQTYTIQHGIEQLDVLVPLKNAQVFEAAFLAGADKSKAQLLEIVKAHDGKVRT